MGDYGKARVEDLWVLVCGLARGYDAEFGSAIIA